MKMKWSYGVTTVPERFEVLLPATLSALERAGFPEPRLFVDCKEHSRWSHIRSFPEWMDKYEVTVRTPRIRTAGNWLLTALELYIRCPNADRYAIFQDDLTTYDNLREYLEKTPYPDKGYQNLYLFPENERNRTGWYRSNQKGLGAVGLVFSNEAIRVLLTSRHFIERPKSAQRGHKAVDGGIVTAMTKAGWSEYVHSPSLIQHIGEFSTMGNRKHPQAGTYLGDETDARTLIEKQQPIIDTTKVGLVGYHAPTGLGELNRQIAEYAEIDTWLVKPHSKLGMSPEDPPVDIHSCPTGIKVPRWLETVDTVLFCETPYYPRLLTYAKASKKKIICVPMMEWLPKGGWGKEVDMFIAPTEDAAMQLRVEDLPHTLFKWPVDVERFEFRQRMKCERFLFVGGQGGYKGRKGLDVIQKLKELWPDIPLIEFNQKKRNVTDPRELYKEGDVLLYPAKVDGIGLQPLEAMASGIPVIATDGNPWNENPSLGRIKSSVTQQNIRRTVNWYEPSAEHLADLCKAWIGVDISEESLKARQWAEQHSWTQDKINEFNAILKPQPEPIPVPLTPGKERWNKFLIHESVAKLNEVMCPVIVEIGTVRSTREGSSESDGYSSIHFANTQYEFHTVDSDIRAIRVAASLLGKKRHSNATIHHKDGVEFLKGFDRSINLLYIDGPPPTTTGQEFALQCFLNANFDGQAYCLIDDCDFADGGKGKLVVPHAVENGWRVAADNGRQVLLERI